MSHPAASEPRFKIIYLELTNACNFSCDYCPIDRQTRPKVAMSSDFARRILDQIAANHLTTFITFHLMGEPYLHRDLAALTGYAESLGLRVRLLTNGSLLETRRNELLFANNLSRLEVGFRTPNDTSFSMRLRGGRLTLEDYVRRTIGVIDDKLRTNAKTVLCVKLFVRSTAALMHVADAYEHLTSEADNLALAKQLRAATMASARKYGHDTRDWEDRPLRIADGEYPIFPGVHLAFSRIQDFWVREQRGEVTRRFKAVVGGCSAGFRDDFGILASGDVTTCCVDYDGKNVIGNLHTQTVMEVLESDEARRIARSFRRFVPPTPFCRECLGGPTLVSSTLKQAQSIAFDIRDRIAPRKQYAALRSQLDDTRSVAGGGAPVDSRTAGDVVESRRVP